MTLRIDRAGLQTTVQGAPRRGLRAQGMPSSGPADHLSMALANRLVGNGYSAPALEISLGVVTFTCLASTTMAITGALCGLTINGKEQAFHASFAIKEGDVLALAAPRFGMRTYLAVAGGFEVPRVFGSASTYLPASFGGFQGRALRDGDQVPYAPQTTLMDPLETPADIRSPLNQATILRVTPSAEFKALRSESRKVIFTGAFRAARQIDRMGIRMEGPSLEMWPGSGDLLSGPVFPGVIQCPEGGAPIILGVDAQTTGGYPRILSVIAADLHLIGQIRPGSEIQLFYRSIQQAEADNRRRAAHLSTWLPTG